MGERRDREFAVWAERVGPAAARAVVSATRWSAPLAFLLVPAFVLIVAGTVVHVNGLRQLAVPLFFPAFALFPVAMSKRRRASRLVRVALGIPTDDNRIAPTDLPPTPELAYQSWLRRMRTATGEPESEPAFAEAPSWAMIAPTEPLLTHSCLRCLVRPRAHGRCGYRDCACARAEHRGWLGPRLPRPADRF